MADAAFNPLRLSVFFFLLFLFFSPPAPGYEEVVEYGSACGERDDNHQA